MNLIKIGHQKLIVEVSKRDKVTLLSNLGKINEIKSNL